MIDINWYEAGVRVLFGIFGMMLGIILTMKFSKIFKNKKKAIIINKGSTLDKIWNNKEDEAYNSL